MQIDRGNYLYLRSEGQRGEAGVLHVSFSIWVGESMENRKTSGKLSRLSCLVTPDARDLIHSPDPQFAATDQ